MMFNLVLKDILVQKKTFLFSALYAVFAAVALTNAFSSRGAYMFGAMSIAYLFIMYSNNYDDRNKCEIMLNSLPINRRDIVYAKYISLVVFTVIGIVITGVVGALIGSVLPRIGLRYINVEDVILTCLNLILMYSLYYPLYFKYGLMKMRYVNMFLYLFFLFAPNIIMSLMKSNPDSPFIHNILSNIKSSPGLTLQLFSIAPVILVSLASIAVSIAFYKNKDL